MRFRHPDGSIVHLAYCTNVHPAEDVDGVVAQLDRFAAPSRAALDVRRARGRSLVPAEAAAGLAGDAQRWSGCARPWRHGLEVVTLNGFPYRGFHAPVVKRDVYVPDWADPARLAYTLDLAACSRAPPRRRRRGDDLDAAARVADALERRVGRGARRARAARRRLAELEQRDRPARPLGLEPEPGCVVETTRRPASLSPTSTPQWIGVCLDACHLAVQFEEPEPPSQRSPPRRPGREGAGIERAAGRAPRAARRGREPRRLRRAALPPPDARAA